MLDIDQFLLKKSDVTGRKNSSEKRFNRDQT
jgi:hypothetical protein